MLKINQKKLDRIVHTVRQDIYQKLEQEAHAMASEIEDGEDLEATKNTIKAILTERLMESL